MMTGDLLGHRQHFTQRVRLARADLHGFAGGPRLKQASISLGDRADISDVATDLQIAQFDLAGPIPEVCHKLGDQESGRLPDTGS